MFILFTVPYFGSFDKYFTNDLKLSVAVARKPRSYIYISANNCINFYSNQVSVNTWPS